MSYDTEKVKLGRKTYIGCGLVMDFCSLTAGVGACTATETGDEKCYNTRATCNDQANYTKTTKEYKFFQPTPDMPIGESIFPVVDGSIEKAPASTTAGAGLGKRAVVRVNLKDFPHHDRGIDPYVSERTYTPEEQGTFWGKFLARNPYYENRILKVYYGYIGDTFSWTDFDVQEYDIVDIDGPDNGMIRVTGKDILIRTYDRKSKYPAANTGELLSDITASAATATLTPTGIGDAEYPASGTVSIGKEAKTFTRSGDVLTFTSHGQWGTEDVAHSSGDTVQICATWDGTDNVVDVLDELLTTGAGVPSAYIPSTDWNSEKSLWLANALVKGILMKPESIEKVIEELSETFLLDLWWDASEQEIKLKALSPEPSGVGVATLTEASNIKKGSLKIKRDSKNRFTEIRVGYNKINHSEQNEPEQFASWQIAADPSRAGVNRYNSNSIKTILTRWTDSQSVANSLAGRLLARFSDTPEIVTFELDQKDHGSVSMAERVSINSWQFQGFSGANQSKRFQILEIDEGREAGHNFKVKALTSSFVGRYFFIAPNTTPDYTAASEEEKDKFGFICLNTGLFADGSDGYKII